MPDAAEHEGDGPRLGDSDLIMSALALFADSSRTSPEVREVPKAVVGRLFDHIICTDEQRWRHCKSDRLGGLHIDHQFKFERELNRKIAWLCAL
jgi:hypothetical protein